MKAHYIFTTNTEKAKINKIIKDKLTEFSTWIDDNEELLQKSDYGVQFCYTEDDNEDDTSRMDGCVLMDAELQLQVIESMLVDLYLGICKSGYVAPKVFLGMLKDDFYAELAELHPVKKSKNTNKQKGHE